MGHMILELTQDLKVSVDFNFFFSFFILFLDFNLLNSTHLKETLLSTITAEYVVTSEVLCEGLPLLWLSQWETL